MGRQLTPARDNREFTQHTLRDGFRGIEDACLFAAKSFPQPQRNFRQFAVSDKRRNGHV
jgi:hypothetical protein